MKNHVCLITGGTRGIGRETARALAMNGATVVIIGRDASRSASTVRSLITETGNPSVSALVADLAIQSEIVRVADEFKSRYDRLNVLVNNAGGIFYERQVSGDGIEMTISLNHLGYFRLTHELRELLVASDSARVVSVSSGAHQMARINFDDLQGEQNYSGWRAYAQSKLANILFTVELARQLAGTGVTANALHPGFVASNFGMSGAQSPVMSIGMRLARLFARSPERGAQTSIYLTTSPEVAGVTGLYFADSKPVPPSAAGRDLAAAKRLWVVTAGMCGIGNSNDEHVHAHAHGH
ncbi:MAG: SDR family oxidoreductase [Chloroflexi bacterium]|nr:SDR family oxidoreductase [Chloroflexota bacterium]